MDSEATTATITIKQISDRIIEGEFETRTKAQEKILPSPEETVSNYWVNYWLWIIIAAAIVLALIIYVIYRKVNKLDLF